MLEVFFYFHYPAKVAYHESYSLEAVGDGRPLLQSVSLGTVGASDQPNTTWDTGREFPIAPSLKPLKLETGRYRIRFYLNGHEVDSATFAVTRPILIRGAL